ncbi:MAG: hypothetical protein IJZ74_04350 [Clostridia bacterium]|nr:hypothetical protein [Clostridia bacterium]
MRKNQLMLLPALLLTVLLWPSDSRAEWQLPYDADTVLSVVSLSDEQASLAEYLYQPILRGETKITLPDGTAYNDVSPAMRSLMQDYPELFHLGREYSVGYMQHEPDIALYISPAYRMEVEQAQLIRQELYAIARDLAARHKTAEALHDALLSRVTYGGTTELCHTAVGALLEGQATCEGYVHALTLLFRMAGVPCGMITGIAVDSSGTAQNHSWNIASIGSYTLIDATWNDQDHVGLNTHWYYGLSTEQMAADHAMDEGQQIPPCVAQANWHAVRGWEISTRSEAYAAVRHLVLTGEMLNLRIDDPALYEAVAGDTYAFLGDYNAAEPDEGFYGGYSVLKSDEQRCVIILRTD